MASATLIGDEGSGRTTFLALLYASLVRFGGEQADEFRLHTPPAALDLLGPMYEDLRCGEFPQWVGGEETAVPSISLGFRSVGPRGVFSHLHRTPEGSNFRTVDLSLARLGPREANAFIGSGGALDHTGSVLLGTTDLLVVLDASRLPSSSGPAAGPHPFDASLAKLLSTWATSSAMHGNAPRPPLRTYVVWTKMDRTAPAARKELETPSEAPGGWSSEGRRPASERTVQRLLPQTRSLLQNAPSVPLRFSPPLCFASWVRLAPTAQGQPPKLAGHDTPTRGWEPEYPYDEYLALIDQLRRSA